MIYKRCDKEIFILKRYKTKVPKDMPCPLKNDEIVDPNYVFGWEDCKKAVLDILDQYHHISAYPYIKEAVNKL